jgi:hypothetical protein
VVGLGGLFMWNPLTVATNHAVAPFRPMPSEAKAAPITPKKPVKQPLQKGGKKIDKSLKLDAGKK